MNIHAIICTRSKTQITKTLHDLLSFLSRCEVKTNVVVGSKSIFDAYKNTFNKIKADPDDIVIFCHDDIEIKESESDFKTKLSKLFEQSDKTGFVGPAGTTFLSQNAVWWDHELWRQGFHRGKVYHINPKREIYSTDYGPPADVVVLDGLFLAAKASAIEDIGLSKPQYFEGEWDFYDIHYTSKAFLMGYTNKILDIAIIHHSNGELVGRESWHKNREAFVKNTKLPLMIKK